MQAGMHVICVTAASNSDPKPVTKFGQKATLVCEMLKSDTQTIASAIHKYITHVEWLATLRIRVRKFGCLIRQMGSCSRMLFADAASVASAFAWLRPESNYSAIQDDTCIEGINV